LDDGAAAVNFDTNVLSGGGEDGGSEGQEGQRSEEAVRNERVMHGV
jgi:hypothetical protein